MSLETNQSSFEEEPSRRETESSLASTQPEDSYSRIVTSSSLIAGSQIIALALGLLRAKLAATLIGTEGVGLNALLQGLLALGMTICGLGLQQSGTREVAASFACGDLHKLTKTVLLLRRLAWLTGTLGLGLAIILATPISHFNFGNSAHNFEIILLGVAILLTNLTNSENAVIQGTRQIATMAQIRISSNILGTIFTLVFYIWLGIEGVAPALVAVSAATWGVTRLTSQQIPLAQTALTWPESKYQTSRLLHLGLALAVNGILVSGVAYLTRYFVNEYHGLAAVGLFSAAFTLSGIFVGFVLSAMSADYYPALTARANDPKQMAKLINQQTEVAMLIAFPGLIGTLFFSPFALVLFYSAEFESATALLRLFILGCFCQVLSWPLGFSILAQGNGMLFLKTEFFFNTLHLTLIWFGLKFGGLLTVPVAFSLVHLLYVLTLLQITKRTLAFSWSPRIYNQLCWMVPLCIFTFTLSSTLRPSLTAVLGGIITGLVSIGCLQQLSGLAGPKHKLGRLAQFAEDLIKTTWPKRP